MKIRKKTLKRLLFLVMLTIVLSNCCWIIFGGNGVYAAGGIEEAMANSATDGIGALIQGLISGIVGIITILPRIFLLLMGFLMKIIMNACVTIGTNQWTSVTFEHIFFSGYEGNGFFGLDFTDVNFFDLESDSEAIVSFRTAIAQWYYIMRLISAAILLVILIYVGIRMAISTIASEQAKYKQMLVDWVTSLALLFLLHYIIMFVISINSSLVSALGGLIKTAGRYSR